MTTRTKQDLLVSVALDLVVKGISTLMISEPYRHKGRPAAEEKPDSQLLPKAITATLGDQPDLDN